MPGSNVLGCAPRWISKWQSAMFRVQSSDGVCNMKDSIARQKSETFALRIIKLYNVLTTDRKEYVLSKQILRSGTSIGANLSESECAISKKDFVSKVYIALKESVETQYWLRLLKESKYITLTEYNSLYADCNEITKILMATTKTVGSGQAED